MKNQRTFEVDRAATTRARILWRDEDSGELLWLVLTGTEEFFEDLGRQGYDLRQLPETPSPVGGRAAPTAA